MADREDPPGSHNRDDLGGGGGDGGNLQLDRLLIELLRKIPSRDKGWPPFARVRWFKTFAMNVSQIYDDDENDPVEMKIELEGGPPA